MEIRMQLSAFVFIQTLFIIRKDLAFVNYGPSLGRAF